MVLWNTLPSQVQPLSPSSSLTPVQPSSSPNCSFALVLPQGHCTYYLYSLKFLPPGTCLVPSGHISHCSNVPLSETASLINPSKVESLPQHLHPFPVSFCSSSLISAWYTFSSLVAQKVNNLSAMQQTQVWSLGWEVPLEKGMDSHSSILAWRIPMSEEPGGLQSIELQAAGHDWSNLTHTYRHTHTHTHILKPMRTEFLAKLVNSKQEIILIFPDLSGVIGSISGYLEDCVYLLCPLDKVCTTILKWVRLRDLNANRISD